MLTLVDSLSDIEKMVAGAMRDSINSEAPKAIPFIKRRVSEEVAVFLRDSPVYNALVNGPLDLHLGIPQGEAVDRLGKIIDTFALQTEVDFRRVSVNGNKMNGGFTVSVVNKDWSLVTGLVEAMIFTDNYVLSWLDWLLTQGDRILVKDFDIEFGGFQTSRSGGAIMTPGKGKYWRVPPQYSGTAANNWVISAIMDVANAFVDRVGTIIEEELMKVL